MGLEDSGCSASVQDLELGFSGRKEEHGHPNSCLLFLPCMLGEEGDISLEVVLHTKKVRLRGSRLAQSEEHGTLELRPMSLRPTLGIELTKINNLFMKKVGSSGCRAQVRKKHQFSEPEKSAFK